MGNLSNLYVSRSFQSLIHIATDNTASANLIGLEDGLGNPIGVSVNTAGDLSISGSFTASLQNGYVWVGNSSGKTTTVGTSSFATPIPSGTISGSSQITALGFVSSSITASSLITASFDNGTRNLTFTKGDAQTFSVNIPDVSGSTINTGSFVTTSSFNAYTSSTDSRLANIESTTASILVETQNLELFSASALISISNLNASSASQQVSINNLNTTTASLLVETQNLELFSASALISISNLNASSASQQISINALNAATSSYATTGSNSFIGNQRITGSLDASGSTIILRAERNLLSPVQLDLGSSTTGDISMVANDVNITVNSGDVKITNTDPNRGIQISGPDPSIGLRDTSVPNNPFIALTNKNERLEISDGTGTIATMNTASFNIPSASFTASLAQGFTYVGDASGKTIAVSTSSFASTISTGSFVTTSSFNAYTASTDSSISQLNASSASQQTSISALNSFTQSQEGVNTVLAGEIDSLQAKTGSYATTGSNNFIGDQNITGNITAFSASFTYLQTIYESSSIIYSSGSNQFGDELSDVQTLSGSVKVQGSLTVNGTPVLTSSVDISGLVTTASFNAYTQSNDSKVNSLINATASYATSAITASSLVTASFSGNTLTFTKGDNSTFGVVIPDVSGSAGDFVTTSSFNAYTQSNDQRVSSLEANSASVNTSITNINSATASLFTSASLAIVTASVNNDDITFTKGDGSQFTIQVATGSFAVSASYAETASLAINAKDIVVDVKNTTGAQINKGTVVRIIGATGDNPLIGTASWTDDDNSANTLGFVVANIPNDGFGRVMTQGTLLSVNTDPALGYAAGQIVYLSGSGQYTNVKPPAPFHEVRLGQVLRAQQNNGSIYVLVQNGYELTELHDVDINTGSLANNDLLAWDSASQQWVNKTVTEVGATTTASFNAYTSSNDAKVNSLISATGSYATTGSNQFNGNQTVNGFVSASNGFYSGPNTTALSIGDGSNVRFISGSNYYNVQLVPGVGDIAFSRDGVSNVKVFTLAGAAGNNTTFQNNPVEFQANVGGVSMFTPLAINAGVNGNVDITGSLKASSTFTASLQQGYVWVGDASGISTTVATSSFGTTINTGSFLTTGSFVGFPTPTQTVYGSLTFNTTGSSDGVGIKLENTGSDASGSMELGVTGPGNPFITLKKRTWFQIQGSDDLNYIGYTASFDNGVSVGPNFGSRTQMLTTSGSLYLFNPNTQRARVMTGVTASSAANTGINLAFNNNTNNVALVISGSNNIYTNPGAATAGFTRYIGGSQNYFGATLPQLTGSAAFSPSMNNNIINTGMQMRLPVSSSAYTMNGNVLMNPGANGVVLGTAAGTNFERAVSGLNFNNNIIVGNINAVASKTQLSASIVLASNIIGGGVNLNMDSSSIAFNGNSIQGTLNVNNSYFPATTGSQAIASINGGLYIGSHTIYTSGSNTTFTGPPGRTITNAVVFGTNNVISASLNGDLAQVASTTLIGQGLVVVGSNSRTVGASAADWGSAFVGRWNSIDGVRGQTAETIFAVGTGTGASTRKTGLLIDSGSNTFIEGTLNVSGSSRFNGNTTITGSLILSSSAAIELDVIGNVSVSGSINVNSGSYNGQAVTNITPVSSSLSPVLNIVTMTSAEYALITPNSQTLYLIV